MNLQRAGGRCKPVILLVPEHYGVDSLKDGVGLSGDTVIVLVLNQLRLLS